MFPTSDKILEINMAFFPHTGRNDLHFPFPSRNLISLVKFRAATLKPKNCFVLSLPRTGILSMPYLFLMTDGVVSTPFRIRPRNFRVSLSIFKVDSISFFLDFKEKINTDVRFFILGLHLAWCGHPWHCSQWKDTRTLSDCLI